MLFKFLKSEFGFIGGLIVLIAGAAALVFGAGLISGGNSFKNYTWTYDKYDEDYFYYGTTENDFTLTTEQVEIFSEFLNLNTTNEGTVTKALEAYLNSKFENFSVHFDKKYATINNYEGVESEKYTYTLSAKDSLGIYQKATVQIGDDTIEFCKSDSPITCDHMFVDVAGVSIKLYLQPEYEPNYPAE